MFAERVARALRGVAASDSAPKKVRWSVPVLEDRGAAQVSADLVRMIMWQHAGIARSARGLRTALILMRDIEDRLPVGATEEANLIQTAWLIAEAALRRKESRGGHYRSDYPRAKRSWRGRHIEL